MQKPSIGRIVHFVLDRHDERPPVHRPAIIVESDGRDRVNLQVFLDGSNDGAGAHISIHAAAVYRDDIDHMPGTWHWPEREEESDFERPERGPRPKEAGASQNISGAGGIESAEKVEALG